ncbi:MAG: tyrosine-protein phosphatase [Clostridia bacterium]|nr:tyrosine-protein phosphatase [Clostridia bacterium]
MKKSCLIFILVMLLILSACGGNAGDEPASAASEATAVLPEEPPEPSEEATAEESAEESREAAVAAPELFVLSGPGGEFDIHTEDQALYLQDVYTRAAAYADGWHECSKPRSVRLEWTFDGENADVTVFRVLLDTDGAFGSPREKLIPASEERAAEFCNLFIGADYYWKVLAICGDKVFESGVSGFSTSSAAPRNLNIEGVSNVRDVGGWIIDGSHRVKQGVVYRGAAFEDENYDTHITEEGVRRAREELGIKTEIELRWITQKEIKSRSKSLLGGDVNYYEFEFSYNDEELLEGNAKSIARCFRTIANEKKHPVYYHCRIGTDRTGVLTYLLLGFLGVEKETLLRDYLFSNFGYVGGNRSVDSIKKAYIDIIDSYEGGTLQEKITWFLKNKCRLSDDVLNRVKELLTEEY